MSFFSALTTSFSGGDGKAALRGDLYKAIQAAESWLSTPSAPGDGISYRQVYSIVQPHMPNLKSPMPMEEVAVLVGAITNLTFELGKADGMVGVIAVQTWAESLQKAYSQVKASGNRVDSGSIGEGITRGINFICDPSLIPRDVTPRVQYLNTLKGVTEFVYGAGSSQSRQAEAYWSSKMIM